MLGGRREERKLECGPLIDQLLRRIRDPHAMGTSRQVVKSILSWSQQLLVMGLDLITAETPLTTQPKQLFYPLPQGVFKVSSVIFQGQDLERSPLDELFLDGYWFRRVGGVFRTFSTVGHDLLVLAPSIYDASTVTIVHPKITAPLVLDNEPMEVDDSDLNEVLELAEMFLLLKNRDLIALKELAPRFLLHLKSRGVTLADVQS